MKPDTSPDFLLQSRGSNGTSMHWQQTLKDDVKRAIAECGVDFVSIGAITKNIRAIDFSLRFV